MSSRLSLVLFLVLVVGGGLAIGYGTAPGEWYASLAKPAFNPPAWVFAPVWTALYVLIAVAGWRVHKANARSATALWWAQLALNFAWSPVFFALHAIGAALIVIVALLAAVAVFVGLAWRPDRTAAWLFLPYAGWVAFATLLNASILWLN